MAAMAGLFWWRGGPALRMPARSVLIAAVSAAVLAVGLYYAHFGDAYRSLAHVRSEAAASEAVRAAPPAAAPVHVRAIQALGITARDLGWPILGLAAFGLVRLRAARRADRLTLTLAALAAAYVLFAAFGVVVPVRARYERYAAEFIGRVDLATYPAAVIAAAAGAASLLRNGATARLAGLVLIGLALAAANRAWYAWIS
jgi:hypothetical protein